MLKAEESGYGEYSDDYDDGSHERNGDDDDDDAEDGEFSDEEEGTLLFRAAGDGESKGDEESIESEQDRKRPKTK